MNEDNILPTYERERKRENIPCILIRSIQRKNKYCAM